LIVENETRSTQQKYLRTGRDKTTHHCGGKIAVMAHSHSTLTHRATHFSNAFPQRTSRTPSRTALTHRPSRTILTALTHNTHGTHAQHSRHSEAGNKVEKPCVRRRRTTAEGITHRQRQRSERSKNVSQTQYS
jgi:hypothetical protein